MQKAVGQIDLKRISLQPFRLKPFSAKGGRILNQTHKICPLKLQWSGFVHCNRLTCSNNGIHPGDPVQ